MIRDKLASLILANVMVGCLVVVVWLIRTQSAMQLPYAFDPIAASKNDTQLQLTRLGQVGLGRGR